jgi:malonyl-CoA O-methyltransferase
MLVACRYGDPVMDMEHLILTYDDVGALLHDLRAHGSITVSRIPGKGLNGRADFRRLVSRYERFRRDDNRLPARFEIIYGHAWKAEQRMSPKGKPVIDIRSA